MSFIEGLNISEETIQKNKELIEEYPFLLPRNRWTGKVPDDYDYSYTELDNMPDGWRIAFGEQMCEEIKNALIKGNYLGEYRIAQIKENFAMLRWYDFGAPKEVYDIISKYEGISMTTCICCGKPATKISRGWISPYCDECAEKGFNRVPHREGYTIEDDYYTIEEFYDFDKNHDNNTDKNGGD